MANTYVKIASVTVGAGGASSMAFTSIPATYTDLVIKASARGTQASASHAFTLRFNGSTANYSSRELVGDGGSVSSSARTTLGSALYIGNIDGNSATSSTFASTEIYIPNYAGSAYKSLSLDAVTENNATEAYATLLAGLWSDSSAITSIDLISFSGHGTLMQYSTATLYGVKSS
jgi:hypothetical protein